jgi:hypothetical protein
MPVIRGPVRASTLTKEKRDEMFAILQGELAGAAPSNGKAVWEAPLIFEIPLERLDGPSDRIDVIVVWNAFEDIRSEERSALILDAYGDRADMIVQALGATREEAMEQYLLPYRILPMEQRADLDSTESGKAMLDEGGFLIGNRVLLYYPNRKMADVAIERLFKKAPNARWALGEDIAR